MLENLNKKIIQGALAGTADAEFCSKIYKSNLFKGLTIGGFSLGSELLDVVNKMSMNGRKEFLWTSNEALNQIINLISNIDKKTPIFLNIRTKIPLDFKNFLQNLSNKIEESNFHKESICIEINAHCQQKEIVEVGTGSALLENEKLIRKLITIIMNEEFISSIKIRVTNDKEFQKIKKILKFKPDIIHADSYLKESIGHNYTWIEEIRNIFEGFIIANNSLYDYNSIKSSLKIANAVSISRPLLKTNWKENFYFLEKFK